MRNAVRVGDYWFRLAEGLWEEVGLRPMRRVIEPLFAERQSIPGRPGWQNVKTEDLRWVSESWVRAGQPVIDASDDASFLGFDRSDGIDVSVPGQLRLAQTLLEEPVLPGSSSTVEGSSWVQDVAPTTVDGTDRRLDALNAAAKTDVALTAGLWEFQVWARRESDQVILGSSMVEEAPVTEVSGTEIRLQTDGAIARTTNQSPDPGATTLRFRLGLRGYGPGVSADAKLIVYNQTDGVKVKERSVTIKESASEEFSLTFTAAAGKTYRYKVKRVSFTGRPGQSLAVEQIQVTSSAPQELTWQVKQGTTVLASGTADLAQVTQNSKVATVSLSLGAGTYTVRAERTAGGRRLYVDKLVYRQVTFGFVRALERGAADAIWAVDSAGAVARRLSGTWSSIGTVAGTPNCLAHTHDWEFIGSSNGVVYRAKAPATVEAYTSALSGSVVGLAVAGGRLLILLEGSNGPALYETALTGTPPLTPTLKYDLSGQGWATGEDRPQLIAATAAGCVFLARQGPDAWVHQWTGSAGAPLARLPAGFVAHAIAHTGGVSWVGGTLPLADGTPRPALLAVGADGSVDQVPVVLHERDDPSGGTVGPIVAHGPVLWVGAQSSGEARLWRVDLSRGGASCPYRTTIGTSKRVRGIAPGEPLVMAATGHSPFVLSGSYGEGTLVSSMYGYGLTEPKRLDSVELRADLPTGTQVEMWVSRDGGALELLGSWTEPARLTAAEIGGALTFRDLAYEIRLLTEDPTVTPVVYALDVRARTVTQDDRVELVLACFDERSVWHLEGQQRRGAEGLAYLYGLASSGTPVEIEGPQAGISAVGVLDRLDAQYVTPSEAYVRAVFTLLR